MNIRSYLQGSRRILSETIGTLLTILLRDLTISLSISSDRIRVSSASASIELYSNKAPKSAVPDVFHAAFSLIALCSSVSII